MITGKMSCKRISRGTMFATGMTGKAAVVHMPVLHMLGHIGVVPGLMATIGTGVKVLAHVDNLSLDHGVQLFEKCSICNNKSFRRKINLMPNYMCLRRNFALVSAREMLAQRLSGGTELVTDVPHGPAVLHMLGLNVIEDVTTLGALIAAVQTAEQNQLVGLALHQLRINCLVQILVIPCRRKNTSYK